MAQAAARNQGHRLYVKEDNFSEGRNAVTLYYRPNGSWQIAWYERQTNDVRADWCVKKTFRRAGEALKQVDALMANGVYRMQDREMYNFLSRMAKLGQ